MIYVTGDTHGDITRFKSSEMKKLSRGDTLIIAGDFGFIWNDSKQEKAALKRLAEKNFRIAFVDGCHENYDLLEKYPVGGVMIFGQNIQTEAQLKKLTVLRLTGTPLN